MRTKKEYWFSDSVEVEEYVDARYGAAGQRRKKKKKATPEQVKKINHYNKVKKIRRMLKNNFEENDFYFTLTFKKEKRPDTLSEAKNIWKKLARKIREEYKKRGIPFKWIILIEKGKRGAIHFHLILKAIENGMQLIRKLWTYGGVYMQFLYKERGDFQKLAEYMAKEPLEGEESYYSHSRNLPIPEPKKKKIRSGWREPKPYKGFYIEKESFVDGINPVTGFRYRTYTMIRINMRI